MPSKTIRMHTATYDSAMFVLLFRPFSFSGHLHFWGYLHFQVIFIFKDVFTFRGDFIFEARGFYNLNTKSYPLSVLRNLRKVCGVVVVAVQTDFKVQLIRILVRMAWQWWKSQLSSNWHWTRQLELNLVISQGVREAPVYKI